MKTGEKITKLRKEHNLTQEQFADLMGVSRQSVSKWELDVSYPETEKLLKMCLYFQCSVDYILREDVSNKSELVKGAEIRKSADAIQGRKKNEEKEKRSKTSFSSELFHGETPILQLSGVSKHFFNKGKVSTVLRDINLSFYRGEFVAITGESGSGKSTLMNMISGAIGYDTGEISFCGKKYSEFSSNEWQNYETERLGYVAQDNKLLMQYTVEQNIISALLIKGADLESCRSKVSEVLELVDLSEYKDQKIVKLSAGQRQRVALARMLAKDSEIILADEITANLDEESAKKIYKVLRNISADRLVLLITHSYPLCQEYVTRHIEIYNNNVLSDELLVTEEQVCGQESEKKQKFIFQQADKVSLKSRFLLTGWNFCARKVIAISITAILFLAVTVLFVCGGLYFINADSITIREFDYSAFQNDDDCRIIVVRKDGGEITQQDLDIISGVENVIDVEKYDVINDINYYYRQDVDYTIQFLATTRAIKAVNNEQFMRSVCTLQNEEIIAGKMPVERNEIVVSKEDSQLLGKEIFFFLQVPNGGNGAMCCYRLKVVGVCEREGTQVFFSEELCKMFAAVRDVNICNLRYSFNENSGYYRETSFAIPIISEELTGNVLRINDYFIQRLPRTIPTGECFIEKSEYSDYGLEEAVQESFPVFVIRDETDIWSDDYRDYDAWIEEGAHYRYRIDLHGYPFVEVSETLFTDIYDMNSYQMTAFIDHYLNTDKVMESIEETGEYKCYSSYRISMHSIDKQKEKARTTLFLLLIGTLVILEGAVIVLVKSLMDLFVKDFEIFEHMGMDKKTENTIIMIQLGVSYISALSLTTLGTIVLKLINPGILQDYLQYFGLKEMVICSFASTVMLLPAWRVTINSINRKLRKERKNDRG